MRVFVVLFEILLVRMRVSVCLPVVGVLVIVLDVFMIVQDVRV
ncbi:MAG: hypothetical protein ACRDRA_16720 [Pseudonocardiaceae bacterium]